MNLLNKLYFNGGILALILTVFVAVACTISTDAQRDGKTEKDKPETTKKNSSKNPPNLNDDDVSEMKKITGGNSKKSGATSENQDKGDFIPVYAEVQNEKYAGFNQRFREQKVTEGITSALNQAFALPNDVTVTFRDCGKINAWWSPQEKSITVCYELMELAYQKAIEMGKSEDEANSIMIGATLFFFFHELGHGMVDVYDLPSTGKEEDAVDQLSTLILMEAMDEDGQYSAASGAIIFKALGDSRESYDFADEHSLHEQRFYNIVCWMYGKDQEKFGSFVQDGTLPEARAVRCPGEYQKMSKAWERLIEPWVKK
ncbi:MAG: DUF4344 domain-containing metallopeptidase [Pyrinomonadaceae bacterium]|nr:DUF4344 domain-containing metallopeptidase [Pyrinomonadaceae bacterium]